MEDKYPKEGFFIFDGAGAHQRILYKDIIALVADGAYTQFFLTKSEVLIRSSVSLKKFEKLFEGREDLIRVHRSYIVNLNRIEKVRSDGILVMDNGKHAFFSDANRDLLLSKLNIVTISNL